jgi:hypothetical protein
MRMTVTAPMTRVPLITRTVEQRIVVPVMARVGGGFSFVTRTGPHLWEVDDGARASYEAEMAVLQVNSRERNRCKLELHVTYWAHDAHANRHARQLTEEQVQQATNFFRAVRVATRLCMQDLTGMRAPTAAEQGVGRYFMPPPQPAPTPSSTL